MHVVLAWEYIRAHSQLQSFKINLTLSVQFSEYILILISSLAHIHRSLCWSFKRTKKECSRKLVLSLCLFQERAVREKGRQTSWLKAACKLSPFHLTSKTLYNPHRVWGTLVVCKASYLHSFLAYCGWKSLTTHLMPVILTSLDKPTVIFSVKDWIQSAVGYISRVPYQNGVSLLYIMLEIHHSGQEPSIYELNSLLSTPLLVYLMFLNVILWKIRWKNHKGVWQVYE